MAFDRAYLYLTAADHNGNFAGKYKRLSFSYSEIPGGTDEAGRTIGPVRTVSIAARGYRGDYPSRLDLEGIHFTLGFDMTDIMALFGGAAGAGGKASAGAQRRGGSGARRRGSGAGRAAGRPSAGRRGLGA